MPADASTKDPNNFETSEKYINKRIDTLEENMNRAFDDLQAAVRDLKEDMRGNNTQINAILTKCQENCKGEVKTLRIDVDGLIGYRNRAIGAVGLILLMLGLMKVG